MIWLLYVLGGALVLVGFAFLIPQIPGKNRFIDSAGDLDMTKLRAKLSEGADPNCVGWFGLTPLTCAVQQGRKSNVILLLEHGANPKGRMGKETPLHAAVQESRLEIAEILLKAGADPNQKGFLGISPFVDAVLKGDVECVRLFLDHGADMNEHYPQEDSVFFHLLEESANEKKPAMATKLRSVVKLFLERGANPNERTKDDTPAIGIAMQEPALLRMFVEHGAITDVHWKDMELKEVIAILLSPEPDSKTSDQKD